jgi:hypothetical protein
MSTPHSALIHSNAKGAHCKITTKILSASFMTKKNLKQAQEIARASIYDGATHLGKWNGYEVYEPTYDDDVVRYTGFPQFILAKDGVMRWTADSAESSAIMKRFYQ